MRSFAVYKVLHWLLCPSAPLWLSFTVQYSTPDVIQLLCVWQGRSTAWTNQLCHLCRAGAFYCLQVISYFRFLRGSHSQIYMYKGDSRTCAIFISVWGSNWGILVFPAIKITMIRQVRMYCSLSVKINTRKMPHSMRWSWTYIVCICFHICGRQKPEYPQFEPHGWQPHYTGWYTRSGISFVYLWSHSISWSSL